MNNQKYRSKTNKHIIICDEHSSDDEYFDDEIYENEFDKLNNIKKGGVYCIDFNREKSKKIGIPSLDEHDNIQYNIKIGRCKNWKNGRKQNYDNMNVFSHPPRLLFFCETDDEVKMEAFFHKSFKNATLNDPTKRELFKVNSSIDTKKKLTKTFTKIMKESKIPAHDDTNEQRIDEKKDMFLGNKFDKFIIRKGYEPKSNQHILKRINVLDEIKLSFGEFKNKIHLNKLLGLGGTANTPRTYTKNDFDWDITHNYIKLVEPSIKIISRNEK